ncbi:MAG: hypothetical protein LC730_05065, partial [Acidobacteria bacterium]|nr:hypothetical protein [Acidobacteriota bacterium]
MNRVAAITVAVMGVILIVLGALKIAPGLIQSGVTLIVFACIIVGLSFIGKPEADETPRQPTAWTLANIFFSPGEVFQHLRR